MRTYLLFLYLAAHYAFAAAGLELSNVTVGRNLQTGATVKLTEPAPETGLAVTVTSSDPARLRLSERGDKAGTGSIILQVRPGFDQTPEFWLQAFDDKGEAAYTATASGSSPVKATATLTPSAIAIAGPFSAPTFQTTTGAAPSSIRLYPVRLDSALKVDQQQTLAGGLALTLNVTSANPAAGVITSSPLTLKGGEQTVVTLFKPAAPGSTKLDVSVPPGFRVPVQFASILAVVRAPGIAITSDVMIGENLQVSATVGLGEPAPPGGSRIVLTSDDPSQLVLSSEATEVGSKSITVTIAEGGVNARFYLQALGRSGVVTYSAFSRGYVSRSGTIGLAPSGIVLLPPNGPPDEAELLRKEGGTELPAFLARLSKHKPTPLNVFTAQLDPVSLRSSALTVQPLRAGVSVTVNVENRDPAVGTVTTRVTIAGGSEHGAVEFTPLRAGSTILSAITPENFTKSANSTSVKAVVKD